MLTRLRIQGFKSWADTGDINLGRLTGFFGTNSSGKTSLLQFLLMLKQTVESTDRSRVLHTGDVNSYVDLGTFYDIIHKHQVPGELRFEFSWDYPQDETNRKNCAFSATINTPKSKIILKEFHHQIDQSEALAIQLRGEKYWVREKGYRYHSDPNEEIMVPFDTNWYETYFQPNDLIRFYGITYTPGVTLWTTGDYEFFLEYQFRRLYYLGPLREYPGRLYPWAGERPSDVGRRGERTIEALLASEVQYDGKLKNPDTGKAHTLTQHIAYWLKRLGLIYSFKLKPIARNRKEYEVRIKQSPNATDVALTDVGFGVSQVLPVLTLCFYAPQDSTILFEQPEIHLHPAVQSGLADVFLDAIKQRGVQIILESHSEHLLHRLQRRIAEEQVSAEDVRLYFAQANDGESKLTPLDLDEYGNIRNWPKGFFGDEIGDLMLMTQAAMKRKIAERGQKK